MIEISVIVPVFNAERTVRWCLQALMRQSFPSDRIETLVVDDGSNDGTRDIVKEFAVRYLYQENQGPAAARNRGAQEARGNLILFTDADCVPEGNWVEEMVAPFKNPEVVGVKGAYENRANHIIARLSQLEFEERYDLLEKSKSGIDMVDTYAAAFRKEMFLNMGGFDLSFPVANNEDTEFSYRLSLRSFLLVFNRKAVVYHLNHAKTLLQYMKLKFGRGYWRTVVYRRFPGKMKKDTYTPQILKLQVLVICLLVTGVIGLFFVPSLKYLLLVLVAAFFLTTIPFCFRALQEGSVMAVVSPFFLLARACALGLGAFASLFRVRWGRRER